MNWKFKSALLIATALLFVLLNARIAAARPPACSLLTQAQVSAALGVKVGAGHSMMGPGVCSWSAPVRADAPPMGVELNLVIPPAFDAAKKGMSYGVAKTTEIKGVGDDAVYTIYTDPHQPPILTVKKGNAAFQIAVTGFSNDQVKAKEKTLAVEVCSKL